MNRTPIVTAAIAAAASLFAPALATAATATLTPSKDNTLFEDPTGGASSGQGTLYVGNTGAFSGVNAHRTLLAFDVASALPAGATVTAVSLSLHVNKTVAGTPETAEIHRLLANWGEGTSVATTGSGAPATPGDATWIHTFYSSSLWSTPGGDFSPTTSASTSLGGVGSYTFASTPQLVADVQAWLNSPATNFGWIVLGDEANPQTVRAIDSRESATASFRPTLSITYAVPEPTSLFAACGLALPLLARRRLGQ